MSKSSLYLFSLFIRPATDSRSRMFIFTTIAVLLLTCRFNTSTNTISKSEARKRAQIRSFTQKGVRAMVFSPNHFSSNA